MATSPRWCEYRSLQDYSWDIWRYRPGIENTGERLILSNNHVIANSNDAAIGDQILQPGPN